VLVSNLPLQGSSIPVHVTYDEIMRLPPYNFNHLEPLFNEQYVARVYMWPSDRKREIARYPQIGEIPLTRHQKDETTVEYVVAPPEGRTVSGTLTLPEQVRAGLFDPNSPLYISPEQETRAFEVFYCIESNTQRANGDPRQ